MCPQLYSEFKASLGYMRSCLTKTKQEQQQQKQQQIQAPNCIVQVMVIFHGALVKKCRSLPACSLKPLVEGTTQSSSALELLSAHGHRPPKAARHYDVLFMISYSSVYKEIWNAKGMVDLFGVLVGPLW